MRTASRAVIELRTRADAVRLKRVAREIERATEHPKNPDTAHDLRVAIRRFTQMLAPLSRPSRSGTRQEDAQEAAQADGSVRRETGLRRRSRGLRDAGLPPDHPAFARFQEHRDHGMRDLTHSLQRKQKWDITDQLAESNWRCANCRPGVRRPVHPRRVGLRRDASKIVRRPCWNSPNEFSETPSTPCGSNPAMFRQDVDLTAAHAGKPIFCIPSGCAGNDSAIRSKFSPRAMETDLDAKIRELARPARPHGRDQRLHGRADSSREHPRGACRRPQTVPRLRDAAFRDYWRKTFSEMSESRFFRESARDMILARRSAHAARPALPRSPEPKQTASWKPRSPQVLSAHRRNQAAHSLSGPPAGFPPNGGAFGHTGVNDSLLGLLLVPFLFSYFSLPVLAQSLGNTGTIRRHGHGPLRSVAWRTPKS